MYAVGAFAFLALLLARVDKANGFSAPGSFLKAQSRTYYRSSSLKQNRWVRGNLSSNDEKNLGNSLASSTTSVEPEKFAFESNVSRVMDIIINSLYSNKDVFIRELISNAADACDKKRFMSLTDGSTPEELRIRVSASRDKNTLTIEDSGIGMNKEDLVQNLGRIAESGTKKFKESIKNNKDEVNLIGQFGVGFYSGFLVADRMEVVTKGSKGETLRWAAAADSLNEYSIESIVPDAAVEGGVAPIEGSTGTRITLHLKDESDQYLDDVALRALIEKYSEFIPFPIE